MEIKELIARVADGEDLSEAQAAVAMGLMMAGEATQAQAAALLMALRIKGETVEEITGFARVMRDRATRVPHNRHLVVDTCGTGGGGAHTFHISTTGPLPGAG